jgi:hypothetical protein
MMLLNRILRRPVRSILQDSSGVSMIEFGFALPIVVALGLGGLETANLALAHLRVSQIGMTAADNAARVRTTIDETDIEEVFEGARLVGEAIDFEANGRLVLSSLQHNGETGADEGQMINWQRCTGAQTAIDSAYGVQGDGRTDDSLESMGANPSIAAAPGTAIMFVEVTYNYQPLFPNFMAAPQIRYESAFSVRERVNQDITNTTSIAVNNCT